jgi:hypothetical protein
MDLVKKALKQIKEDVKYNDITPILTMLEGMSTEQLEAYLVTSPASTNSQKYMDEHKEQGEFFEMEGFFNNVKKYHWLSMKPTLPWNVDMLQHVRREECKYVLKKAEKMGEKYERICVDFYDYMVSVESGDDAREPRLEDYLSGVPTS